MSLAAARDDERGFTLIEALVAAGILTVVLVCALGAVTAAVRAANGAAPRSALAEAAQNVLADLRAATAYDPDELTALAAAGPRQFSFDEPQTDGSSVRRDVTAAIVPNASEAGYAASVTVSDATGNSVSMHSTLVEEAPAPGSVLPLSTPPPVQSIGGPAGSPGAPGGCDPNASTCRAPCLLAHGCRVPQ
jgi:type II secretory pathway pseudopilin PulG